MTFKELQEKYGLSNAYFASMKKTSPDRFTYIFGNDENKKERDKKYQAFLDEVIEVRQRMAEIRDDFENNNQFVKWMKSTGFYSQKYSSSLIGSLNATIDISDPKAKQLSTHLNFKKIIEIYDQQLKDGVL